jgi:small subunit ribosomal protein S7
MASLKLFGKWSFEDVTVGDPGLKSVIALKPMLVPHSFGRHEHRPFGKAEVNVVERLVNWMMHFGRSSEKAPKNTGRMGGKKARAIRIVQGAFELIHLRTGENPIQVLVRAIENAAPNEDTTRIVYGGTVYYVSVDVSPLRRINLALKHLADGARAAAFKSPIPIEEALANEIIMASRGDANSYAIRKKHEIERIALASR